MFVRSERLDAAAFFAGFQTSSGSRSPERNVSAPARSSTDSVLLNA
jgi:hypothetical protein